MTILIERHEAKCNCSYCGGLGPGKVHYGLNIPADWWAHNSWYVIKFWPKRYFRWTNRWMPRRSRRGR